LIPTYHYKWTAEKYAGFSTVTPWQKENESYTSINAKAQIGIPNSTFEYWAQILKLRKEHKDIFIYGDFRLVDDKHEQVFAYTRTDGKDIVLVVSNFGSEEVGWQLPEGTKLAMDKVLTSNFGDVKVQGSQVELRPFEAFACFVK
jgi:glycosidase